MIEWIIGSVGGVCALWAALAYLTRVILEHNLKKDLDKFSAELKSSTDLQISRFNSELKINEFEHQLRFSKVYERQMELIAKLYEHISQAEIYLVDSVRGLRYGSEPTQQDQEKKFAEFYNKAVELYRISRIYIPSELCVDIDRLFSSMRTNHGFYNIYHPFRDESRRNKSDEDFNKWQETITVIEKEIPAVRAALEEKFRKLLNGPGKP
jgi:hypothetical protein